MTWVTGAASDSIPDRPDYRVFEGRRMDVGTAAKSETERTGTSPRWRIQCPFLGAYSNHGYLCRAPCSDGIVVGDRYVARYCSDAYADCSLYLKADAGAWERVTAVQDGNQTEARPEDTRTTLEKGAISSKASALASASSLDAHPVYDVPDQTVRQALPWSETPVTKSRTAPPRTLEAVGELNPDDEASVVLLEAEPVHGDTHADTMRSPDLVATHPAALSLRADRQPVPMTAVELDRELGPPEAGEREKLDAEDIETAARPPRHGPGVPLSAAHGAREDGGRTPLPTAPLPARPIPTVSHPVPANGAPAPGGRHPDTGGGRLRRGVVVAPFILAGVLTAAALVLADSPFAPGASSDPKAPAYAVRIHALTRSESAGKALPHLGASRNVAARSWYFPTFNGSARTGLLLLFNPGRAAVVVTVAGQDGAAIQRGKVGPNESAEADLTGTASTAVLKVGATAPIVVQRAVVRYGVMQPVPGERAR